LDRLCGQHERIGNCSVSLVEGNKPVYIGKNV